MPLDPRRWQIELVMAVVPRSERDPMALTPPVVIHYQGGRRIELPVNTYRDMEPGAMENEAIDRVAQVLASAESLQAQIDNPDPEGGLVPDVVAADMAVSSSPGSAFTGGPASRVVTPGEAWDR